MWDNKRKLILTGRNQNDQLEKSSEKTAFNTNLLKDNLELYMFVTAESTNYYNKDSNLACYIKRNSEGD
jgi:hypothetical protein